MGLVEITAGVGDVRPFHKLAGVYPPQDILETANATEEFWRQADLAPEFLNEMLMAHSQRACDGRDVIDFGALNKSAQRPINAFPALRRAIGLLEVIEKETFEDLEFCGRTGRGQQAVAPIPGGGAPQRVQFHDLVAELTGRQLEEGGRSAWLEMGADHRGVVDGVDNDVTRMRAREPAAPERSVAAHVVGVEKLSRFVAQVDHQLERAVWKAFFHRVIGETAVVKPEKIHERRERQPWRMTSIDHASGMAGWRVQAQA